MSSATVFPRCGVLKFYRHSLVGSKALGIEIVCKISGDQKVHRLLTRKGMWAAFLLQLVGRLLRSFSKERFEIYTRAISEVELRDFDPLFAIKTRYF